MPPLLAPGAVTPLPLLASLLCLLTQGISPGPQGTRGADNGSAKLAGVKWGQNKPDTTQEMYNKEPTTQLPHKGTLSSKFKSVSAPAAGSLSTFSRLDTTKCV